jgi:uncharacterized protein (DUF58 family)
MFTQESLSQIRRLQLRAKRAVQTLLGGDYQSAFKGTGLSFEDVREYQPGDDVRCIDWNVTARMGTAYLKRYVEERELTIMLLLDVSGSQRFGTGSTLKRTVAAELAALIGFAAVSNNDRVGLLAWSDRLEHHVRPNKGGRHILRLLRDILFFEPQSRGTNLRAALDHLRQVQKRRAVVFLFSDFLTDDQYEDSFRHVARQHDLIAVRLGDDREQRWPNAGLLVLEDAETGEQRWVDTGSVAFREAFAERAAARNRAFEQFTRSAQVDAITVGTEGRHFEELIQFFRRRDRQTRNR